MDEEIKFLRPRQCNECFEYFMAVYTNYCVDRDKGFPEHIHKIIERQFRELLSELAEATEWGPPPKIGIMESANRINSYAHLFKRIP